MIQWCLNGLTFYSSILAKINDVLISWNCMNDAMWCSPISFSHGFSSAFTTIHRVPARIAVGLDQSILKLGNFTHKMQAFWEYLQHSITTHIGKVYANIMFFMVELDFQEVGHNQPSWTDWTRVSFSEGGGGGGGEDGSPLGTVFPLPRKLYY